MKTTRRQFVKTMPVVGAAFAVTGQFVPDQGTAHAQASAPLKGHFDPKGKPPSKHTIDVLRRAKETLPFSEIGPNIAE